MKKSRFKKLNKLHVVKNTEIDRGFQTEAIQSGKFVVHVLEG